MGLTITIMRAFIAFTTLLALAAANQSSHQSVKHGNAPTVHTSIHRPHGSHAAVVHSQPAATPDEVHQYGNEEKYTASTAAKADPLYHAQHPAKPHHGVAPYHAPVHHAPIYHGAPVHHAPVHHAPVHHAPVYHAAPVHHAAPVYKPAPVHKPAYHPAPAPAYKPAHPAPYHEPAYDAPPVYNFAYAVADDYSSANFDANENRDGYATTGGYRVALPDGRTQIVTYSVNDAYSGYVADVQYEGEAHYAPYEPKKPAYHPAPAYHA